MGSIGATSHPGEALRSPLHDRHLALGAKLALFAGWQMPLEYAGGGVLKEHTAVRETVGVFDVSHLGKAKVTGPGAAAFLNRCLTADLERVPAGHAQYTLCCDDTTGGVIDDLVAYRFGDDDVTLIPNAANTAEVVRRLVAAAPPGIEVRNHHRDLAVLAVQGPRSAALLDAMGLPTSHPYLSFEVSGDVVVCRTGYTGEHGYELVLPVAGAPAVWDALIAAGAQPCGLGARDTLRTEMGYALHGQDLSPEISPVQARVGWAVGWTKPGFWGQAVLAAERAAGPARLLWGIEATDRGIPRPHMAILAGADRVGEVTSGTFSPTRRVGIGLALIDTSTGIAEGDEVAVDVRGRPSRVRVVRPPFVPSRVR